MDSDTFQRALVSRGRLMHRPGKLMRFGFRIPRWVYDLHLGWLFGHRLLLIVHRGRTSGRIYRTALEVVRYERSTSTSIVISAWGERSDWFRNIRHNPALQINTGRDCYVPDQRILSLEETDHELDVYASQHRLTAKILERVFGFQFTDSAEQRRAFSATVRMVAFRPRSADGPSQ